MSGVSVEPLVGPYDLSEGPHWDQASKKLYFVDIFAQKMYRYDPATKALTSTHIEGGPIGFAVPVDGAKGKWVAGVGTDLVLLAWDGEKDLAKCATRTLLTLDDDPREIRWNDGKVDKSGRLWGGTMGLSMIDGAFPANVGAFYSVGSDLRLKKHASSITISNGVAWSPNDDKLYYIDSTTYKVVEYDYNAKTGDISNKKTVFDVQEKNLAGMPDGMTVDADGNLWVAVFGGGGVYQVHPKTGEVLRFVKMPHAQNVTSVAFGGDDLDILYVTTATTGLTESELKEQPNAGYVFAVKGLGVRGLPANSMKLSAKLM